jgi:hypothetical protein
MLSEILYSLVQTEVEPLAAAYTPTFETQRAKWQTILLQEIALIEAMTRAQAAVDKADRTLDRFVDKAFNAVEEHTTGETRKRLLKSLLKGQPRSRFRRPVLGRQLRNMEDWAETLKKCGVPALAALADEAAALWTAGQKAEQLLTGAKNANRDFRNVGERKQFVDGLNADRKEIDGALAKLPFQNPALPQDFNEWFFLSEAPRDDQETVEDVSAAILELEAQLAARKAQIEQMKKDAADEAAAAAAAARAANNQQAADLRAQAQALLDRATELEKSDE